MKVAGLVFSARRIGNGYQCMKYCLEKLEKSGLHTILVNAFDYEIKPCSHCNYECYAEEIRGEKEDCPIEDDVPRVYGLIKDADALLFALPCYGGHVPAIYRAWRERVAHAPETNQPFKDFDQFQKAFLNKILGIVVIGNLNSLGDMTLHEVMADFYNLEAPEALLLQSREFGKGSLKGDLMKSKAAIEALDRFLELVTKRITRKET